MKMAGKEERPYRQVARARATERTRETLLEAASEAVQSEDWTRSTLESVAQRAGVTKQTALRHFGSKQGLFEEVLRRASTIVVKERDEPEAGDIANAVASLMRHYERHGELATRLLPYRDAVIRVLGQEDRDSLVRRTIDYSLQAHEQWVTRIFAPQLTTLGPGARERRRAQLIAICDVYMWKMLRRDLGLSLRGAEAALVELIERLLAADEIDGAPRDRSAPRSHTAPRGRAAGDDPA